MTKFYYIPNNVTYYMNLHLSRTIQIQYRNDAIVYAIRCQVTSMQGVHSALVADYISIQYLDQTLTRHCSVIFTSMVLIALHSMCQKLLTSLRARAMTTKDSIYGVQNRCIWTNFLKLSCTILFGVYSLNRYIYILIYSFDQKASSDPYQNNCTI